MSINKFKDLLYQETSVLWECNKSKDSVILTKKTGEKLVLKIGTFITYEGRPDGVKITDFSGDNNVEGPIGMFYTPWRKDQQKWAEPKWSLRGDMRHIIALPCGVTHWGEQINWNSVVLLHDGKCPDALE
jgi:hypothetical protein